MKELVKLLRPAYIRRFREIVRQEGWRAALAQAFARIRLAIRGHSPSGLFPPDSENAASKYHLSGFWSEIARGDAFHVISAPAVHRNERRIAVIGDLNLPQCRKYRVEQLTELWQTGGVTVEHSHFEDIQRSISILQTATHLLLYRLRSADPVSMYLYEARRLRLPVVYDIDDPLFSVSAYETYGNMTAIDAGLKSHFRQEAPNYLDVMNACDAVSLSTPGLQAHAELYTQRPVFVRRNFADRESLEAGTNARRNRQQQNALHKTPFTVVFASGSLGHEVDFRTIEADVISFLSGAPDRQLLILGHFPKDHFPTRLSGQIRHEPFQSYQQYLQMLATADCAIMPLADDVFNQCKSAVRVIDAASVSIPAIVNEVGDMSSMVRHKETGLIIPPGGSWRTALEELSENRAQTNNMGARARADLESNWNARLKNPVIDPAFVDWIRG